MGYQRAYLKCKYNEGMFPHEYAIEYITFGNDHNPLAGRTPFLNSSFVNKKSVIPLKKNLALVDVILFSENEDSYQIGIRCGLRMKLFTPLVPKNNIVFPHDCEINNS